MPPIILWTIALLLLASAFIGGMLWFISYAVAKGDEYERLGEMLEYGQDPHIVRLADFTRDNRRPSVRSGGASLGHLAGGPASVLHGKRTDTP